MAVDMNEWMVKTMKEKAKLVVEIALVVIVVGIGYYSYGRYLSADGFGEQASGLSGKSEGDVIRALGEPESTYSGLEYAREGQKAVSTSYEPDPPTIEADSVLVYRKGLRIVLVFIVDARVAEVYSGLT
jgi:hypothetical protein